jgi:HEAT repeat protein
LTDFPDDQADPQAAPDSGAETGLDEVPVGVVRELFLTLGKALRAFQLYDENNPVYKRFVSALGQAFLGVWEELERLHVSVEEDRFLLMGEEVYKSDSRSDSLAFLFFKDGIREIAFEPGIEEELEAFLSLLQQARSIGPEGDDLLTLLWDADFRHFNYHYIDVLAEGVELPEAHPPEERAGLTQVLEGEMGEEGEEDETGDGAEASSDQPISRDDFNPTLYSLDPRERQLLEEELAKEMGRDLRRDVLRALFDRLEESGRPDRQSEIVEILGSLIPNFLSRGEVRSASEVLDTISLVRNQEEILDGELKKQVDTLLNDLSSPETVAELLRALEAGSIQATPEALGGFLRHLRTGALGELLRASQTVEDPAFKETLNQAVLGIATTSAEALIDLLDHEDDLVVAAATRLIGVLNVAAAGPKLAGLMRHPDPNVRLAAIGSAVTLKVSDAVAGLQLAITDPDREIRIEAARAIGTLANRPAAEKLRSIVVGKEIRQADLTEKIAFFEAYGLVGDAEAMSVLDRFLNGKRLWGRRAPSEMRACAALALGKLNKPKAEESLKKAINDEDPVVRNAVQKALRGEDAE